MNNVNNGLMIQSALSALDGEAMVLSSIESVALLIEEFSGISEIRNGTYNRLHAIVAQEGNPEGAEAVLDKAELLFIESNFSVEQIAADTTKAGKVKRSKFLPADYQSAKSVLLGALTNGVSLFDAEGNPIGKSALSRASCDSARTPQEKIGGMLDSLLKAIHKEAPELQAELLAQVAATVDGWNVKAS